MTTSERKQMLKRNTILWLVAMVAPGIFHIALGSTRFPWPIIIPLLLLGCLLSSNNMLSKAMGSPSDTPAGTNQP
ncbi:hypothetical protein DES53_102812 [Roseimicrobium gellanilyticum]|uniref:Uncharacterized protein n=1 Tax=Roseimicrobium gellanilyticum TaxID=748857 RepID=A0A366HRW0_9BACT|nr:hypothetical protein [Roseimicrobium gellanilyticum]RBP46421.1 hypothetical protein DES53_102812 [Roseimicrobium gellanilyticum]